MAAAATNTPEDRAIETNPPSAFKRRRCDRKARDSDWGTGALAARFKADGGGALRSDWGPAIITGEAADAADASACIMSAFCRGPKQRWPQLTRDGGVWGDTTRGKSKSSTRMHDSTDTQTHQNSLFTDRTVPFARNPLVFETACNSRRDNAL